MDYDIEKLQKKSCKSFLINILLELPRTKTSCVREYQKTEHYNDRISGGSNSDSGHWVRNDNKTNCLVNLGTFEYNLLRSWADEYFNPSKLHVIEIFYEEDSIIVNMGPGSNFTWCGESKQKMNLTLKDNEDSPSYCMQVINRDFKVLKGQVRIDLAEFENCEGNKNELEKKSFRCVEWEDIKMSVSLNLSECHDNLKITRKTSHLFNKMYQRVCEAQEEKCYWEKEEKGKEWGKFCFVKQNIKDKDWFTNTTLKKLQSLKATKFTGTISMREEAGTGKIFLNDSEGNLECWRKKYEIQSLGKE